MFGLIWEHDIICCYVLVYNNIYLFEDSFKQTKDYVII